MLMEVTHLSMEERLKLWKERKNEAKKNLVSNKLVSNSNAEGKTPRKRNLKYVNSSLSSDSRTSPHCNNNMNKAIQTQKRTKKENDQNNENIINSMNESKQRDSLSGIKSDMNDLHITDSDHVHKTDVNKLSGSSASELFNQNDISNDKDDSIQQKEIEELKFQNSELTKQTKLAVYERKQAFKIANMSVAEIDTLRFENEILTQNIEELEMQLSHCRMSAFEMEDDSEKVKKQEATIRYLRRKNEEYEKRANTMVAEITEQMTTLQEMAMKRIQQLENDLMVERHKSQSQESTIRKLQLAQEEMEESKKLKSRNRRKTRRQSCFVSVGSMGSCGSDATQEASFEDDDGDDEREYDLELGANDDED